MEVKLIRQLFENTRGYKIDSIKWCCDKLKDHQSINLYDEYTEANQDVPAVMIRETEIISDWEDKFEQDHFYQINFCPFCGEKNRISVIKDEDVSGLYQSLKKQEEELRKKYYKEDSKKKGEKLKEQIRKIDDKINWFYELEDYDENYLRS